MVARTDDDDDDAAGDDAELLANVTRGLMDRCYGAFARRRC